MVARGLIMQGAATTRRQPTKDKLQETMNGIQTIDPTQATGKRRELLDAVHKKLGAVPNLTRVLAHAPAALEGYLGFGAALSSGALDARLRELIALTVAEVNQCEYCLSAHSFLAAKLGLPESEVLAARRGTSATPKTQAILSLARGLVVNRGWLSEQELGIAREAGVGDGEIVETIANVALNVFTNYLNHVAETAIDFPRAVPLETKADVCSTGTCHTR